MLFKKTRVDTKVCISNGRIPSDVDFDLGSSRITLEEEEEEEEEEDDDEFKLALLELLAIPS